MNKFNHNTRIIGVIGHPIKHSFSPLMHNLSFELLGLDYIYLPFDVPLDGTVVNICSNDDYDGAGNGNKLATYRYLRLELPASSEFDVRVIATTADTIPGDDDPNDPRDRSDPDIFIFLNGLPVAAGVSGDADQEIFRTTTRSGPDTYVADLREFRYADPESPVDFPDRMCFDVSFAPVQ